jgi:adenine-specific DNA glycosylase
MVDYINIKNNCEINKNNINIKKDFFFKKTSNKRKIINIDNINEEEDKKQIINDNIPSDISYFPRKKIKAKSREIIISVCIFSMKFPIKYSSSTTSSSIESSKSLESITKYLFVKRSASGLLANQWEFPNIIVWEENNNKNNNNITNNNIIYKDDFEINDNNLMNLFPSYFKNDLNIIWDDNNNNTEGNSDNNTANCITIKSTSKGQRFDPILHIFSHQRHEMHIFLQNIDNISNYNNDIKDKYRENRWLSSQEIRKIGITTGCKKILDIVSHIDYK